MDHLNSSAALSAEELGRPEHRQLVVEPRLAEDEAFVDEYQLLLGGESRRAAARGKILKQPVPGADEQRFQN